MNKTEEYIINESAELSVGESPKWVKKILSAFPAFASRNYQLFFSGQLISFIGTWLQIVAEGWLVTVMTNSAFWIGMVAAAASLPVLLFSLFGGIIVDRYNKKKILYFTQIASMILAFIYGVLIITNHINIYEVLVLAFLLGCVTALELPARQAFVAEMIEREKMSSAIALNASMFNGARVIGPSIAGFLISLFGTGGAFILNAISFIPSLISIHFIKPFAQEKRVHPHPITAMKQGILYAAKHPVLRDFLIISGFVSIFGWSYSIILPLLVKNVYHQDAAGLGYFFAASGFGALLGSFFVSAMARRISQINLIFFGGTLFTISLLLFGFAPPLLIAIPLIFLTGFGIFTLFMTMNIIIQHTVSDEYRGRVMSIFMLVFIGFIPFSSLEIGFLSEHLGTMIALQINAIMVFFATYYLFFRQRHTTFKE